MVFSVVVLARVLQKLESFMFPLGLGSSSGNCSGYWWPCWEDHHPSDLSGESGWQLCVWQHTCQPVRVDTKCLCVGRQCARIEQRVFPALMAAFLLGWGCRMRWKAAI